MPEAGPTLSQAASSETLQLKLPAPKLLTVMLWLAGAVSPSMAAKDMPLGLSPMVGVVAASTVRVTGTICGEFSASPAETVIVAECVSADMPAILTLTVTVQSDPPATSHDWSLVALHFIDPDPVLLRVMV